MTHGCAAGAPGVQQGQRYRLRTERSPRSRRAQANQIQPAGGTTVLRQERELSRHAHDRAPRGAATYGYLRALRPPAFGRSDRLGRSCEQAMRNEHQAG